MLSLRSLQSSLNKTLQSESLSDTKEEDRIHLPTGKEPMLALQSPDGFRGPADDAERGEVGAIADREADPVIADFFALGTEPQMHSEGLHVPPFSPAIFASDHLYSWGSQGRYPYLGIMLYRDQYIIHLWRQRCFKK
jgi:hypothetical protein